MTAKLASAVRGTRAGGAEGCAAGAYAVSGVEWIEDSYNRSVRPPKAAVDEPQAKRKRGRPKAAEATNAARRAEIVEAAFGVLSERSYDQASMADIAERAGLGNGTVYRYFSTKRELLDHVFDYAVQKAVDALALDELSAIPETYEDALRLVQRIGSRLFDLVDAEPALLRLITVQSSAVDAELHHRVVGVLSMLDTALTDLFVRVAPPNASSVEIDDWVLLGRAVLGMAGPGAIMAMVGDTGAARRQQFLEFAEDVIDLGLLVPPSDDGDANAH